MRGLGATNAEAFIEAVSRKLDEGVFKALSSQHLGQN